MVRVAGCSGARSCLGCGYSATTHLARLLCTQCFCSLSRVVVVASRDSLAGCVADIADRDSLVGWGVAIGVFLCLCGPTNPPFPPCTRHVAGLCVVTALVLCAAPAMGVPHPGMVLAVIAAALLAHRCLLPMWVCEWVCTWVSGARSCGTQGPLQETLGPQQETQRREQELLLVCVVALVSSVMAHRSPGHRLPVLR